MEKNMNNEIEVTTEVIEPESDTSEVVQEITIEDLPSGSNKGFAALVAGGIAAVAIGATIAIRKHKKKKTKDAEERESNSEEQPEEDIIDVDAEEVQKKETSKKK